jgi:hypothetical protein
MKVGILFAMAILVSTSMISAHLISGSLVPKGDTTLTIAESITIKWGVTIGHEGFDIALSTDGNTWQMVGAVGASARTYIWKVPNSPTATARIRICQKAGTACTDAQNTSSPEGTVIPNQGTVYTLVSGNFTIAASSSVQPNQQSANAPSLRFLPDTRNVEVAFALTQGQDVSLQAFDTQGKLLATLVEGRKEAGNHRFSVFSNRLNGSGPLLFKLNLGGQVHTENWNGQR